MAKLVRYAWFVLVFNVGVIVFGAYVRATGSGAGCGRSWPTCQPATDPAAETERAIEFTHRRTAAIAIVLVVLLAVLVWRATSAGHPARKGAVLAVVAGVGEALIGALIVLAEWVADDASIARAISVPLHLVNTFFLLGALTLTVYWLSGGTRLDFRARPHVGKLVLAGGLALVLIAATGAVTALADTLFPKTGAADVSTASHFLTDLRVIHPILALVAAVSGWWAASRSDLGRSPSAAALPALVGLMLLSGLANIALGVPWWMQVVHLALADALWVAFVLTSARALQVSATASRLSPSR